MKINSNLIEIKVGRIYHWDVKNIFTTIHEGTKTVKVLGLTERINKSPLAKVQSVETKEIFETDSAWLQHSSEYLQNKFYKLLHYYKKNKPELIYKWSIENKTFIIVGNRPEVNQLILLDKDGIFHRFGYSWFDTKKLGLKRNYAYDREQEEMNCWFECIMGY